MKNYFKKFSIMFMMALAIIGVGAIQNGLAVNAATIGQRLTQAEDGWKRYDGSDSRIIKNGNWTVYTNTDCYNSTNNCIVEKNLGSFEFSFYGTEFRLLQTISVDLSRYNNIYIDGELVDNISVSHTSGSNIRTGLTYEKTGLPLGVHKVKMEGLEYHTWCFDIDAIDIDSTGYLIDPNESISLDKQSMNLTVDETKQLTATTTPASVGITWKLSDPSIVKIEVDPTNGKFIKVNALKEGTCTITATTADGSNLSASCTINVKANNDGNTGGTTGDGTSTIVNIAHAKGDNTNNPDGDVTIIFHGTADTTLSVVKTADVKDVWVGDTFTYTIVVTNTGTKTAKAVVVNDPAPNHIDFVVNGVTTTQGTVDSSSTSKNIIVNVGDIPAGGTVTIKVPATVIL